MSGSLGSASVPIGRRQEPSNSLHMFAVLGLFALVLFGAALFAARPATGGALAVIVPPHHGEARLMRAIAAADGTLVRQSRYPWLAVAEPQSGQSVQAFRRALAAGGVVLTLHPAMLAGCFDDPIFLTSERSLG